jgi:hypothetical protein
MTSRLVEDAATSLVATTYHIPLRGNVSSEEVSFWAENWLLPDREKQAKFSVSGGEG